MFVYDMMKNIYSTDDNLIKIAGIRLCLKYCGRE